MTLSRNAFRSVLRRSRLAGLTAVVGALLAAPGFATAQELQALGHSVVPGSPLVSFDISWVDQTLNTYWLADRSNKSVDVMPIGFNPHVFALTPTGVNAFAGSPANPSCIPGAGANDCAGPNGVIVFNNTHSGTQELWVGDGPTLNPVCGGGISCSTVKVFTSASGNTPTQTINTGGKGRADELCFDPVHKIVMIANDVDSPPFVSIISTDTYQVLAKFSFTNATNGIEQCAFNPADNSIYLNIPEISGDGTDSTAGAVVRFSAGPGGSVNIDQFPVNFEFCAGPQGLDIDRGHTNNLMLGCNATSLDGRQNVISVFRVQGGLTPTDIISVFPNAGGADQVWFQPATNHFSVTGGSKLPTEQFTLIDGIEGEIDQTLFVGFAGSTTRRAHSVASWFGPAVPLFAEVEVVILPIPAVGGTPAPFSSTLCGNDAAKGCVSFFGGPPDSDDPGVL